MSTDQAAPFTGPGLAMPNALISLAGGTNIFASLKAVAAIARWLHPAAFGLPADGS